MTEEILTALVGILTFLVLRGGWRRKARTLNLNAPGDALILGGLAVAAAMYFWGVMGGLALIVTVMVHDYGHVAAYRVAGHQDATFRLIPLFGGVAISKTQPKSDLADFYITVMGPGICLILMTASYLAIEYLFPVSSIATSFAFFVGAVAGMLNFLNLLPLYPLDGGRIMRVLTQSFSPKLAYYVTIGMCLLLIAYALLERRFLIAIFAIWALQGAMNMPQFRTRKGLTLGQTIMAAIVWFAMLAAFFLGGRPFLTGFF